MRHSILLTLVTSALPLSVPAFAQPFTPTHLGSLTSGGISRGHAINASHTAVGFSPNASPPFTSAFSWTSGGGMAALPAGPGTPPLSPYSAHSINAGGEIVGSLGLRAFKLSGSTLTDLGTLSPLLNRTQAWSINVRGEVVGDNWDGNFSFFLPPRGFIYRNGVIAQAGPLRTARDINDLGFVAGSGGTIDRAMLWDSNGGTSTNLGTLGGINSQAHAVNNANAVVGRSTLPTGATHAFYWTAAGGMVNLSLPAGAAAGWANDINSSGQIVGWMGLGGVRRAAYWHNGAAIDLNTWISPSSGWTLDTANGINDAGCIVGTGQYLGIERAYILCVPAPGALTLAALCGFVLPRRGRVMD